MARVEGFEVGKSGIEPVDVNGNPVSVGVWGDSDDGMGVFGASGQLPAGTPFFLGILGEPIRGSEPAGVVGHSVQNPGVIGRSEEDNGVIGESRDSSGVFAASFSEDGEGVLATNLAGGDGVVSFVGDGAAVVGSSRRTGTGVAGSNFAGDGGAVPATGVGVDGFNADTGTGVRGHSPRGTGVQGTSTGVPETSDKVGVGVAGSNFAGTGPDGAAVPANGVGVDGFNAGTGIGVRGHSPDGTGVQGTSNIVGVRGSVETNGFGVWGKSNGGQGVRGESFGGGDRSIGVSGKSFGGGGQGVRGESFGGGGSIGVSGSSGDFGIGVHGENTSSFGIGVSGENTSGGSFGIGVAGQAAPNSGRAGFFDGGISIINGPNSFKIDHPLDPENKYLVHTSVESSEKKNVYDGVARLDEEGAAWIELPEWFEALNGDFRYQLTAVGGSAPGLHVAEEVSENRFKIAGGEEGMKVCWQVTGTRKDPWATANPFEVEQEKPEEERGRYLDPALYDAPEEQRVMIGPPIPEAVEEEQRPPQPSGIDFARLEEEHRRQLDEWRRREEEQRREMEELRRRMEEQQGEEPPEST
jgi:hypothetical protein